MAEHWVIEFISHYTGSRLWSEFGYGHVVLGDYNIDDVSIHACLEDLQAAMEGNHDAISDLYTDEVYEPPDYEPVTKLIWERLETDRLFLELLLCIPETIRNEAIDDYLSRNSAGFGFSPKSE